MMEWREQITLTFDYDFEGVTRRLVSDPLQQTRGDALIVPLTLAEGPRVAIVRALDLRTFEIEGDGGKGETIREVARRFRFDGSDTAGELANVMPGIYERFGNEMLVLDINPFSALIRSIIHQQVTMSFAKTLTHRVFEKYGANVGGIIHPPTPAQMAEATIDDLRTLQLSTRKAEYLLTAARSGISFDDLHAASDAEIAEQLIALKGVGPWTVQNVLMFGYGRPDLFPASDIGILRAIGQIEGERPSVAEATAYSERYAPFRSKAAYLLWRSVEE